MTITLGWWALPAAITILSIGSAFLPDSSPRGYGDLGSGIVGMFHLLIAVIVSLAAWLLWAVL